MDTEPWDNVSVLDLLCDLGQVTTLSGPLHSLWSEWNLSWISLSQTSHDIFNTFRPVA